MASVGRLILGFLIAAICFSSALAILALQMGEPLPAVNIGTNDIYTNVSSGVNVTTELLATTGSYGTGFVVVILFVLAALIVLAAVALIGRKGR
jgi:hypothetical protein